MASTSSSSSTEVGQTQEAPDWVLPIYPDNSWAANVDFLIMVIRRVDKTGGPDVRQLQGCLECFSATIEQDATESFTTTEPATAATAHPSREAIQADKTRFKRRWTTQGKPCTELIRKTVGLDEIPGTQIDLLFVFRAVVPAGSWAFYLDKTSGVVSPCLKDNQVCTVQVSSAMNAVTCARLYEG
ncbi:hypothetical protein MN608_10232 [Microdochium nivale]|nr:hypothetical protein MN608_10232 [Microdochium nivale]